jgi:hypothetical protein
MRKGLITILSLIAVLVLAPFYAHSELQTVVGATIFGGAERGTEGNPGGIGGVEGFGLFPFSSNFGLQGSMRHEGGNAGNGGYRLSLSGGPVYGYASGKLGLNVDYQFIDATNSNFIFLRGVWAHYFDNFDFVLSYSQPVHEVQRGRHNLINLTSVNNNPP